MKKFKDFITEGPTPDMEKEIGTTWKNMNPGTFLVKIVDFDRDQVKVAYEKKSTLAFYAKEYGKDSDEYEEIKDDFKKVGKGGYGAEGNINIRHFLRNFKKIK